MNRTLLVILVMMTGLVSAIKGQQPVRFVARDKKINIKALNADIGKMIEETGVPSLSLAIIDHDAVVFSHTYGWKQLSKKDPSDDETIFEGASMSKSFLVFAVYQLVQEGLLDLDKPMYQYLRSKKLEHDQRYLLITPRMILNHSSGLENWQRENNPDLLEMISDPGKEFTYSGEGYNYLARVVEKLLNKPYKEYIEEKVIRPLQLKRSYAIYTDSFPGNCAMGHDNFGDELEKWTHDYTVAASGMHTTAKDYAELVLATFDKKHLSAGSVKEMLVKATRLDKVDTTLYYGPGYEVIFNPGDTIVAHGGNNEGYKSYMYYSVTDKCGFAFLTNSDLGLSLIRHINELTVRMKIDASVDILPWSQYPGNVSKVLKLYRQKKDTAAVLARIDELEKAHTGRISSHELTELGWIFTPKHRSVAQKMLEDNIRLYPDYPLAYYFMGQLYMEKEDYESAYKNLSKAKELKLTLVSVDPELKICADKIKQKNL